MSSSPPRPDNPQHFSFRLRTESNPNTQLLTPSTGPHTFPVPASGQVVHNIHQAAYQAEVRDKWVPPSPSPSGGAHPGAQAESPSQGVVGSDPLGYLFDEEHQDARSEDQSESGSRNHCSEHDSLESLVNEDKAAQTASKDGQPGGPRPGGDQLARNRTGWVNQQPPELGLWDPCCGRGCPYEREHSDFEEGVSGDGGESDESVGGYGSYGSYEETGEHDGYPGGDEEDNNKNADGEDEDVEDYGYGEYMSDSGTSNQDDFSNKDEHGPYDPYAMDVDNNADEGNQSTNKNDGNHDSSLIASDHKPPIPGQYSSKDLDYTIDPGSFEKRAFERQFVHPHTIEQAVHAQTHHEQPTTTEQVLYEWPLVATPQAFDQQQFATRPIHRDFPSRPGTEAKYTYASRYPQTSVSPTDTFTFAHDAALDRGLASVLEHGWHPAEQALMVDCGLEYNVPPPPANTPVRVASPSPSAEGFDMMEMDAEEMRGMKRGYEGPEHDAEDEETDEDRNGGGSGHRGRRTRRRIGNEWGWVVGRHFG